MRVDVSSGIRRSSEGFAGAESDILAHFDMPGSSNCPTKAISGRLEHLRGIALGFRNLNHYILRSLIHSGQLQDRINAL